MATLLGLFVTPSAMIYSLVARGGHIPVLAGGALCLLILRRYEASKERAWMILLGLMIGLSYYTYKQAITFIVPLVIYATFRTGIIQGFLRYPWRNDRRGPGTTAVRRATRVLDVVLCILIAMCISAALNKGLRLCLGPIKISATHVWSSLRLVIVGLALRTALSAKYFRRFGRLHGPLLILCLLAVLIGLSPMMVSSVFAPTTGRKLAFELADGTLAATNFRMMWYRTLPKLLGHVLPGHLPKATHAIWPLMLLGPMYLLGVGRGFWVVCRNDIKKIFFLTGERLSLESLLLMYGAATVGSYCLSRLITDTTTDRYLLPLLIPLPVLCASACVAIASWVRERTRVRYVDWCLVLIVCAVFAWINIIHYQTRGFLDKGSLRIARVTSEPRQAVDFLEKHNIRSAYGTYWIAYHLTLLAEERVKVAPYHGMNERKPPDYAQVVKADASPAYIFLRRDRQLLTEFREELAGRVPVCREHAIPGYLGGIVIFHAAGNAFPHDL